MAKFSVIHQLKPYWWLFTIAFVIRVGIILYTSHIDSKLVFKYTDIDYAVYSDAARIVLEGGSPYARSTYRYSPLLAYFMLPNSWYPEFGKMLFALLDVIAGVIIAITLLEWGVFSTRKNPATHAIGWSCLWLLNPLVINMSTRGSADVIAIVLIFLTLLLLLKKQTVAAALVYGFTVHFRIYPIVYAPALFLYVGKFCSDAAVTSSTREIKGASVASRSKSVFGVVKHYIQEIISLLLNRESLKFTFFSAGIFFALMIGLYFAYGFEFLYETYLYHFVRKDIRHNFSPYFYFLYLSSAPQPSAALPPLFEGFSFLNIPLHTLSERTYERIIQLLPPLIAFLPQFSSLLIAAFCLYRDLPACLLIQTLVFVAFNKVCTAQYFLWWVSILPLVLPLTLTTNPFGSTPTLNLSRVVKTIGLVVLWFLSETSWLLTGLYREVYGRQVYLYMWCASIVFFGVNVFIMYVLIKHHPWSDFCALTSSTNASKKRQ